MQKIDNLKLNKIKSEVQSHYNRLDSDGRKYYTKPLRAMGSGEETREARPSMYFPLKAPDGTDVYPIKPDGTEGRWRWGMEKVNENINIIEWVNGKMVGLLIIKYLKIQMWVDLLKLFGLIKKSVAIELQRKRLNLNLEQKQHLPLLNQKV